MMRLRLTCKSCGTAFAVDARHAGKTGRCPNPACGAAIKVPSPKKPVTAAEPPAPPILPPRRGASPAPRAKRPSRRTALPYVAVAGVFAATVGVVLLLDVVTPSVTPAAAGVPTGGTLVAAEPAAESPANPPEDPAFKETIVPFLQKYCSDCHGPDYAEADLNFAAYDSVESLQADRKKWNQVLGIVRIGAMPPSDHEPQPPMEVRKIVTDWLDRTLNYVDCQIVDDPGHVTIRRLNRVEYDNTIRDLVGIDFKPAADFPSDDVGNGFDNQGEVLSLPPLLMEKYLDAAEQVTDRAIVTDFESLLTKREKGDRLASTGEVARTFGFRPGEYVLRAEVQADQAGDELAKAEFRFDGKPLQTFEVQGQRQPNVFQVAVNVEQPGEKTFAVAFLNDFYDEKAEDRRRDRNLDVNWLEVVGPKGAVPELPETHTRIVFTSPRDGKSVRQAAEEIFTRFVARAYRRPADPVEVKRLVDLVEMAVGQGEGFEQAVAYGVQAVLVSPHFLFRVEDDVRPADDGKVSLGDYELASRLSYFLWSSMPDDELFDLAARGELSKPEVVRAQVKRMLADPKVDALVVNFFGQWLNLRNLDEVSPDYREYPWWNTKLQTAMRKETELFCAAIVREDRSVLDALDADFTFVNPRLAELYGVQWNGQDPRELYYSYKGNRNDGDYRGNRRSGFYEHEDEFVRVSLPPNRRGVLTHASVLALTSNPGETSPVKRGKWILENILGTPPPPAPPGVPAFDEAKKAKPDATLREQLELHRSDPGCASCHNVMDPLGLGFENFDVIGKWRDKDGNLDVDASGTLEDGQTFQGA
ncbi:MAG TPA: DUF1592 domain-containing protein, partial [Planctomycetaceae bacterium]